MEIVSNSCPDCGAPGFDGGCSYCGIEPDLKLRQKEKEVLSKYRALLVSLDQYQAKIDDSPSEHDGPAIYKVAEKIYDLIGEVPRELREPDREGLYNVYKELIESNRAE